MDKAKLDFIKNLAFEMADKLQKNGLTTFALECDDVKIHVGKDAAPVLAAPAAAPAVPAAAAAAAESVQPEPELTGQVVKSPIVGTFYAASSPDAEPFVRVGSPVKKGDVLCIVEAMKMLNEIESEFDGTVRQILVQDGEMVEFDQPILVLE